MHALIGTELSRLRAAELGERTVRDRHVRLRRVRTTRIPAPRSSAG